ADVRDLLFRIETRVSDGDDVDAELGELRLKAGHLRLRPVVTAVVHDNRRFRLHLADATELLVGQPEPARRRRRLIVWPGAEHLVLAQREQEERERPASAGGLDRRSHLLPSPERDGEDDHGAADDFLLVDAEAAE